MTIPNAVLDELQRAAQRVTEETEDAAVSRLMERLSSRDDAAVLRDALTLLGARALVADAVQAARGHDRRQATEVAAVVRRLEAR